MEPVPFRGAALDRLSSPDRADHLIVVTDRRAWLIIAFVALILSAALVWSVEGRIPIDVAGDGVLVREGGLFRVVASDPGILLDIRVGTGDTTWAGHVIAIVRGADGQPREERSVMAGTVVEVLADEGSYVERGKSLVSIEQTTHPLQGILFVPLADAERAAIGMPVYLLPVTARAQASGYLLGRVTSVGRYPATPEGLDALFHNTPLVSTMLEHGARVQLAVELERERVGRGAYAYRWTTGRALGDAVVSGTTMSGFVRLGERRPISFLLPAPADRAP